MLQRVVLIVLFLSLVSYANCCDFCGSNSSGNYFGILPMYGRQHLSVRYQYSSFTTKHFVNDPRPATETYQTVDIYGRYYPHQRIQLFVFVPLNQFSLKSYPSVQHQSGLGDISLLCNVLMLNSGDSLNKAFKHTLTAGAGVKLPTGRYDNSTELDHALPQGMQLGSGSVDFISNINYSMRWNKHGVNLDLNSRWNTSNSYQYRYGHRIQLSARYFYWKQLNNCVLLPHAGSLIESIGKDRDGRKQIDSNSGQAVFASLGMDVVINKFTVGLNAMIPAVQNNADGMVKSNGRYAINFSYFF
ncbi:MAG TPA: transporter [Saprospiraceae bacterium]|nr:transporter [Saprospiraceae bacterium]